MISVKTALTQYFDEHVADKAVDWKRIQYAMMPLLLFFGETPIGNVDIPLCRQYRKYRKEVKDSTVRYELIIIKTAANHALHWRRLKSADLPTVELPAASETKQIWLFKDELSTLLETASIHDRRVYRFLQLAYHTAARREAIETLQWVQVDLTLQRINLRKESRQRTNKRRPLVPLSKAMTAELVSMNKSAVTPFVLVHGKSIYKNFVKIAQIAGLLNLKQRGSRNAGRLTPHILRHSRATHLLQDGKAPWMVANLLGDSLATVLRVYGHSCADYLQSLVDD